MISPRIGWGLSILACLLLAFSASAKLVGGAEFEEGFTTMGLPLAIRVPLGILELLVALVYIIPATSVLGGILFAGCMGGAIMTHWRVGDPFIIQAVVGIVAWLGLWLRDDRLKRLLPVRERV